jgi:hypothetical protein
VNGIRLRQACITEVRDHSTAYHSYRDGINIQDETKKAKKKKLLFDMLPGMV